MPKLSHVCLAAGLAAGTLGLARNARLRRPGSDDDAPKEDAMPATEPPIRTSGWKTSPAKNRWPGSRPRTRRPKPNSPARRASSRSRARSSRSSTRTPRFPTSTRSATTTTTSGRTRQHERGLWRRTTLERIPQARAEVGNRDRPRRAGQGRERELGLARRRLPARRTTTRCLVVAVARRLRCRRHPRVRPRRPSNG